MAAIHLDKLSKDYGHVKAVKEVSLEVKDGELFALLGPNGAGKTTILSILVGLDSPTSGAATVLGFPVGPNNRDAKLALGSVPQETVSHGFFNVVEILRFHSGFYGLTQNDDRIEFLVKRLGLWDHRDKKVRQLSGGMKRRLLIAKSLVHNPKVLLLDEPTAGVDVELRTTLWEFVRELNSQGVTILLTTHYLEEAEHLCERIGILHHGTLLSVGPTSELVQKLTSRFISVFVNGDTSTVTHPALVIKRKGELRFKVPSHVTAVDILKELSLPIERITDIKTQEGTLEEAFMQIIKEKRDSP